MSMRVLVAGSRFWTDWRCIMTALSLVWEPDAVLVTGACPEGAEDLAARCWGQWGGWVERWEFGWDEPQGTVVPSRHRRMIQAGADVCLTFGSATGPHMLGTMARAAGVPTHAWSDAAARSSATLTAWPT